MKIYLAADHAGFELKEKIKEFLSAYDAYEPIDLSPETPDPTDDYPEIMKPLAKAIHADSSARGIIFGGSGQGEAIVVNRCPGVRAVVYYGGNEEIIRLSREHNDANVLSFGARFISANDACAAAALWLSTPFSGEERHVRRIAQIDARA